MDTTRKAISSRPEDRLCGSVNESMNKQSKNEITEKKEDKLLVWNENW